MKVRHTHDEVCLSCEEKLSLSHSLIRDWFHFVKSKFLDCHISCVFRSELEQNKAFIDGASMLEWPNSKHNKIPSMAIDIFQLKNKKAVFNRDYYSAIWNITEDEFPEIEWGGNWLKFKDYPHFEIKT